MDYARVAKDTELKNVSASDDGSSIERRKRSSDYQIFEPLHSRVVRFLGLLQLIPNLRKSAFSNSYQPISGF